MDLETFKRHIRWTLFTSYFNHIAVLLILYLTSFIYLSLLFNWNLISIVNIIVAILTAAYMFFCMVSFTELVTQKSLYLELTKILEGCFQPLLILFAKYTIHVFII